MVLYRVIITVASAADAPVSRTAAVGVSLGGHSRRVWVRSERINERRRRRWENRSPSLPGNLVGTHTYSHKYTLIVSRYMGFAVPVASVCGGGGGAYGGGGGARVYWGGPGRRGGTEK